MAKLRTRGKTAPVIYWHHKESGRIAMTRGSENAKDKRLRGFETIKAKRFMELAQGAGIDVSATEKTLPGRKTGTTNVGS